MLRPKFSNAVMFVKEHGCAAAENLVAIQRVVSE
jgi:hypothetical protein